MTYTKLIERLYNSHDAETLCADAALVIEALSVERDALQAENERLTLERDVNKRMRDMHFAEKSALAAQLDAMGKGEAVAYQYREANDDGTWRAWAGSCKLLEPNQWREVRSLYAAPKALAPLTGEQVVEGFCNTPHQVQYVAVFDAGVRFAEAAHGIHAKGGQQ